MVSRDGGETWGERRTYSNPGCLFTSTGKVILHYWVYTDRWRMDSGRIDLRAASFDEDWLYS